MASHRTLTILAAGAAALAALVARAPRAEACGCFTPPDPSVPIVQAGERIAFAMEQGKVIAHIQIQYSGAAEEFGWLLPLPTLPDPLQLGTDELFAQLISTTQPKYIPRPEYVGNCPFDPNRNGGFGPASDSDSGGEDPAPEDTPLVLMDSVGPYDYAVLRADSKQPMLDWLAENRFFVPAGTDTVVDPYIRPNAYFLALKLRKGQETGDLQPVVVKYQSDLPMIPIVLTSVAADPNMGVMVWVLGQDRAIPRNYNHTVINDAKIDWLNFGANYVEVITEAVDDAEGGRAFVTEYAGTSSIMVDLLDYPGRFGSLTELRALTDAIAYVQYLSSYGYGVLNTQTFTLQFPSQLLSLLQRDLPVPAALLAQGVTPNDYYTNIGWWLGWYRDENPELFTDLDTTFDPVVLTDEIELRLVLPTLEAGQLFRAHSYMTRMFTTLSPEEMTRDPVFSFNPDLPEFSNLHEATITYYCGPFTAQEQGKVAARLVTEDGWRLDMPHGTDAANWDEVAMPASRYTQILREEGDPIIVWDRSDEISDALNGSGGTFGCSIGRGARGGLFVLALVALAGLLVVRRRR